MSTLGRRDDVPLFIRPITPEETYALRHSVLWPDKPLSYVQLEEDFDGWHFGAFLPTCSDSSPVSVISVFLEGLPGESVDASVLVGRFRKFATAPEWQGRGIGTALLTHTIAYLTKAKEEGGMGATQVWCDARVVAKPFYERFGMVPEGGRGRTRADEKVFYKGDIPYLRMVLDLDAHHERR